jgi:hypothetical protein
MVVLFMTSRWLSGHPVAVEYVRLVSQGELHGTGTISTRTSVRAARVLSPKPRFSYLDSLASMPEPSYAYHFRILLLFSSFRYFLLYLNCQSSCLRKRIDVQERRVAACFPQHCVLVPEVRPTRHSKDTRISRIRRLLATPSTSYLHNPPLCHTNTRTHLRARTPPPTPANLYWSRTIFSASHSYQ